MEQILAQVTDFGFPIVISLYLLVRIEKKLDVLTQSINKLSKTISCIQK